MFSLHVEASLRRDALLKECQRLIGAGHRADLRAGLICSLLQKAGNGQRTS
jgi:hypothetical protein